MSNNNINRVNLYAKRINDEVKNTNIAFNLDKAISVGNITHTIKKIVYSGSNTIIFWEDGTNTRACCDKNDSYNRLAGLLCCVCKKFFSLEDFFYLCSNNILKEEVSNEKNTIKSKDTIKGKNATKNNSNTKNKKTTKSKNISEQELFDMLAFLSYII